MNEQHKKELDELKAKYAQGNIPASDLTDWVVDQLIDHTSQYGVDDVYFVGGGYTTCMPSDMVKAILEADIPEEAAQYDHEVESERWCREINKLKSDVEHWREEATKYSNRCITIIIGVVTTFLIIGGIKLLSPDAYEKGDCVHFKAGNTQAIGEYLGVNRSGVMSILSHGEIYLTYRNNVVRCPK